jgi:hypothetical protein
MDPFSGQRWSAFTPERIAWHMFTVGVLALLLLVLIVSVESLGDPPSVEAAPPETTEAPVEARRTEHGANGPVRDDATTDAGRAAPVRPVQRVSRISAGFQKARMLTMRPSSSNFITSTTSM